MKNRFSRMVLVPITTAMLFLALIIGSVVSDQVAATWNSQVETTFSQPRLVGPAGGGNNGGGG